VAAVILTQTPTWRRVLFTRPEKRYTRLVQPRIELDESAPDACADTVAEYQAPSPAARQLVDANWEHSTRDALMLYVAEEPRVGLEFSYHGLDWRIVAYCDGWVAKLEMT
jgi:hypothetical protein